MKRRNEIIAGEVGHTKIKREYGMYSLYKLHEGESQYRKIMESTDYEVIRPHRHEHRKKWSYKPPPPITIEESRAMQTKAKKGKQQSKVVRPKQPIPIGHIKVKVAREAYHVFLHTGNNHYKKIKTLYKFADTLPYRNNKKMTHNGKLKYRDFPEPPPKVPPIPKTPAPKKVVQTMDATLKAKDKALEKIDKPDKLIIKEKDRPQKVAVQIDSKTTVMVYPDMVENAREKYRKRHKQSQEQNHHYQRKAIERPKKQKEPISDLIFYN